MPVVPSGCGCGRGALPRGAARGARARGGGSGGCCVLRRRAGCGWAPRRCEWRCAGADGSTAGRACSPVRPGEPTPPWRGPPPDGPAPGAAAPRARDAPPPRARAARRCGAPRPAPCCGRFPLPRCAGGSRPRGARARAARPRRARSRGCARFLGLAPLLIDLVLLLARLLLEHVALDVGALLAHLDVDRARAALGARELELALRLALQRDLARRGIALALAAAVAAAQVRQQLELGIVADAVVGAVDLDAGLIELHEQPVDRHLQDLGKLGNGTSAIAIRTLRPLTRLEPGRARRHDELAGFFGRQPLDVRQIVHRLLGEILARAHAAARQRQRQIRAHALEQQQVVGRHRLIERLLARDRLRQQHVARAVAQLLDDVLVELLDARRAPPAARRRSPRRWRSPPAPGWWRRPRRRRAAS